MKSATNKNIPNLVSFGQASFDEDMKVMDKKVLVGCVSKDENIDDFDNLWNKTYYKKSTEINITTNFIQYCTPYKKSVSSNLHLAPCPLHE